MTALIETVRFTDEELKKISGDLETGTPQDALRWAVETYGQRVALATGFGAEGCVLVHMLSQIDATANIFYLDTDVLFPETYELRERLQNQLGVQIRRRATAVTLEQQAKAHGDSLWERQPDECCRIRKVEPLKEVLSELSAWVTAIRRDQSSARAHAGVVERDAKFGIVKINPLVKWSSKDVWSYIFRNDVPYNPLHDRGYPSIGCTHCTSPVQEGEDPRSGRWRGKEKTECGLHQ